MRGEHWSVGETSRCTRGPSPRARGAQTDIQRRHPDKGTIPACAASTTGSPDVPPRARDHPRVRGEHGDGAGAQRGVQGPSPRARGALGREIAGISRARTIPACAGSTCGSAPAWTSPGDHPRVRGEHGDRDQRMGTPTGPSPRARGALLAPTTPHRTKGTIPACAGSTPWCRPSTGRRGDHPRVRGEHRRGSYGVRTGSGPSPRARGARHPGTTTGQGPGTIPACAGSTPARSLSCALRWDHPRVRGEHQAMGGVDLGPRGPSPRARGARARHVPHAGEAGTIPACAGSTPLPVTRSMPGGDHPRVRGEHVWRALVVAFTTGPSPRARGSTTPSAAGTRPTWDHPRVRGEH